MNTILADYHDERTAFDALLQSDCQNRILLFHGESGSGKTSLLRHCRERARQAQGVLCVNIDLKGAVVTIAEVFTRAADRLGRERLASLAARLAEFQDISEAPSVTIENNRQSGFGNQINVTLNVNDPTIRERRREALTEALFLDIKAFRQFVLFIFDTYEQANTEVQDWIRGPFLARIEQAPQARILVAGQRVPDQNNIDWGHCCTAHHLRGVPKAEHWIPVVEAMGLRVPAQDALSWLDGICGVLKGHPSKIMQHLEAIHERSLRYE